MTSCLHMSAKHASLHPAHLLSRLPRTCRRGKGRGRGGRPPLSGGGGGGAASWQQDPYYQRQQSSGRPSYKEESDDEDEFLTEEEELLPGGLIGCWGGLVR